MLFNSLEFLLIFLPLTWLVWRLLLPRSERATVILLLAASLAFYAAWEPRNLLIFLPVTTLTYALGLLISRTKQRWPLVLLICVDLGVLAWFKYAGFLSQTLHQLWPAVPLLNASAILPLGISFYVFTEIAFGIDVYLGRAQVTSPLRYLLFVLFFPHMIAGPIVHFRQLAPQLTQEVMRRQRDLLRGLFIFAMGLCMKVLVADPLAGYVGSVYNHPETATSGSAWAATAAYTMQLYFDFAGYGAMAVGLGVMFGINLPWNFNSPYKAESIVEFWKRWHITLSEYLKEYLYIPLGGNRSGPARRYANLMITMLLGGLWHGAAWSFVIWGGLHGAYICMAHVSQRAGLKIGPVAGRALTLGAVMLAWVFFRAPGARAAFDLLALMARPGNLPAELKAALAAGLPIGTLAGAWALALFAPNAREWSEWLENDRRWGAAAAAFLFLGLAKVLYAGDVYEFIYFRF